MQKSADNGSCSHTLALLSHISCTCSIISISFDFSKFTLYQNKSSIAILKVPFLGGVTGSTASLPCERGGYIGNRAQKDSDRQGSRRAHNTSVDFGPVG